MQAAQNKSSSPFFDLGSHAWNIIPGQEYPTSMPSEKSMVVHLEPNGFPCMGIVATFQDVTSDIQKMFSDQHYPPQKITGIEIHINNKCVLSCVEENAIIPIVRQSFGHKIGRWPIFEHPNTAEDAKRITLRILNESVGPTAQKRFDLLRAWLKHQYHGKGLLTIYASSSTVRCAGEQIDLPPTIDRWLHLMRKVVNGKGNKLRSFTLQACSTNHEHLVLESQIQHLSQELNINPNDWQTLPEEEEAEFFSTVFLWGD